MEINVELQIFLFLRLLITILSYILILPILQMTSQMRSRIEYLITTHNITVFLLHSFDVRNLTLLTSLNTI